jgi:hypothetical protein
MKVFIIIMLSIATLIGIGFIVSSILDDEPGWTAISIVVTIAFILALIFACLIPAF